MKDIKLFDYQEDMKERIEKALRLHPVRDGTNANGYGKNGSTRFGRRIVFEGTF